MVNFTTLDTDPEYIINWVYRRVNQRIAAANVDQQARLLVYEMSTGQVTTARLFAVRVELRGVAGVLDAYMVHVDPLQPGRTRVTMTQHVDDTHGDAQMQAWLRDVGSAIWQRLIDDLGADVEQVDDVGQAVDVKQGEPIHKSEWERSTVDAWRRYKREGGTLSQDRWMEQKTGLGGRTLRRWLEKYPE